MLISNCMLMGFFFKWNKLPNVSVHFRLFKIRGERRMMRNEEE